MSIFLKILTKTAFNWMCYTVGMSMQKLGIDIKMTGFSGSNIEELLPLKKITRTHLKTFWFLNFIML